MADRTALNLIGYIMGSVTAAVMLIGATVVTLNVPDQDTSSPYGIALSAKAR
jgi:hypothetical protein